MIRFGVAGWSYADWEGVVYPSPRPAGFDPLAFLADYFKVVEINNTFYRIPEPDRVRSWVRRVENRADFRFTVKLYQGFTHSGRDAGAAEAAAFKRALEPLMTRGRLGAVLIQFPYSFHPLSANWKRLEGLLSTFRDYPLVVEVRHRHWVTEGLFDFLRARKVGFCNIDQPLLSKSLAPTEAVTSTVGYVRLHGRNEKEWFRREAGPAQRYDYLYSEAELAPWVGRIRRAAEQAVDVFVIGNNHYRGKAPLAALTLFSMLLGRSVAAPAELVQAYPASHPKLRAGAPIQPSLFED